MSPKPKKSDDGSISFPGLHCWNPETRIATIAAEVGGSRVCCRVAIEDLRTKFHIFSDEPLKAVAEHRYEIEEAARKLIESKTFEEDGSIKIRYQDL